VDSSLRFAKAFDKDPRVAPVLTNAADRLYALKDPEQAQSVAERVLALDPPATPEQRRVATTVIAHTAFEAGDFARAEKRYAEVLALVPERDAARKDLVERQAASVYKQGEAAQKAGNARDAVGHFARVASVAPQSAIHATAQYDAAAALIGIKDWDAAARTLEDFRQRFPKHPLVDDASSKLAVAYLERGRWSEAAGEFERVAASGKDPKLSQEALWQAAELHGKGNNRVASAKAYERYLKQYPEPFERAVETRHRLAMIAKADGNAKREFELQRQILAADPAWRRGAHRPDALPGRDGLAGDGAAGGGRLSKGGAGRAAGSQHEEQEGEVRDGAQRLLGSGRLRGGRRDHRGHLPHRGAVPGLRQGHDVVTASLAA
jgi:outer membrane protein assembly factor BamD (BamD/ComL family)